MDNNALEWLINEGCPSIVYRARKEIIQENITDAEYAYYQKMILEEDKVQRILSWQEEDGYFGTRLHTAPSRSKLWTHEGCVRYLLEMGLDNERIKKSLDVMLQPGWGKECENSRAASVFKYELIRASLFAQAGIQDDEVVNRWVDDAVHAFRCVAEAEDINELVYEGKNNKLIFKENIFVPVIYHLRILAFTDSWRKEENIRMISNAYEKLYKWLPLPPMYHDSKLYPVAPLGNVCWQVNQNYTEEQGFIWLHFYEMSARMGMLGKDSPFRKHFEDLKKKVFANNEYLDEYTKKKNNSFVGWSGYSGISLEGYGKNQQQRIRDFIFRVLIIDKYSEV